MTNQVIFYTDEPHDSRKLPEDIRKKILELIGAEEWVELRAATVSGFTSGVNWETFEGLGAVAVVLYSVNNACSYGIAIEVANTNLDVYEWFDNELLKLSNLEIVGKKKVFTPPALRMLGTNPHADDFCGEIEM
jgi:hypothetical protein